MPNRLRTFVTMIAGRAIETLRSDLAGEIDERALGKTQSTGQDQEPEWHNSARKLILASRMERARQKEDHGAIRKSLADFWRSGTSDFFYDTYRFRFERSFLGPHHVIVDQLADLVRAGGFSTLVEVGCGDGRVLDHCSMAMPGLQELVGLDINPAIIAKNLQTWKANPRLRFLSCDAADWFKDNSRDGMILLTYGGVMEYFDSATLSDIYAQLARHRNVAVAMVEPLSPDHDLAGQTGSFTFGIENSFSHNYPHLLRSAGFKALFSSEIEMDGVRWLIMLAIATKEKKRWH